MATQILSVGSRGNLSEKIKINCSIIFGKSHQWNKLAFLSTLAIHNFSHTPQCACLRTHFSGAHGVKFGNWNFVRLGRA
jgi:hypothetical protein